MIDRFLRRFRRAATAAIPPDQRVYAIGDIHGRADLMGRMAGLIERDLGARPVARALTVFLGDYVDRGPESAGVIDRLARGDFPTPLVGLRGNHDALFLDFVDGQVDLAYYEQLGGFATLASYGVDLAEFLRLQPAEREQAVAAAVPAAHLAFLRATRHSIEVGDYFFCHAGARPGVALEAQSEHDLLWIREAFLTSTHDFGKIVVHGHTPVRAPEVRSNRIGVDTQAFASGSLTALVLDGTAGASSRREEGAGRFRQGCGAGVAATAAPSGLSK